MLKKLLIAGAIVVVLGVGAVVVLFFNLDFILKKTIETVGPELTGAPVSVGKISTQLTDSRVEVGGLVIGNPSGYKSPHAFRFGTIATVMAVKMTPELTVYRELTIEAVDVNYEKGTGGSNIEVIQRHLNNYARAQSDRVVRAKGKAKNGDEAFRVVYIVEELQIRDVKVHLTGIAGKEAEISLPPVSMRDLGKSRGGVEGAEIAGVVLTLITDAVLASAARVLAQDGAKPATESMQGAQPGR